MPQMYENSGLLPQTAIFNTLRVTLSEPRDPFQTLVSHRNVTLSRKNNRYPRSNRSSALNTARRLSDSLPPRRPAGCSLGCVPGLGAFEPRFAALAANSASHPGKTQRSGFGGTRKKRGASELSHPRGSERYGAAFDAGQHRICLYVGPRPPHRQMPPRAVPAPVMGRCPKPRSCGKTK